MTHLQQKRAWFWVAVIAITFAVMLLLLPHGDHTPDPSAWMALLPVLFVGLLAPLSLVSPRAVLSLGRATAAPELPSRFQRPPPASVL